MRTMYDSVRAANIPVTAGMVAGYVDQYSIPMWSAAEWNRFPGATKVRIAKKASTNDGHVLDVEPSLATAAEAPGWVRMRRAAGMDPTVYCNYATWASVQAAFTAAKVAQPHYWIAKYDGVANLPALNGITAVAKQYADDTMLDAPYDKSVVADYWPGVDPAPVPAPAPIPARLALNEETEMLVPAGKNEHVVLPCAGRPLFWYLYSAFGHKVTVHQCAYVMPTPAGAAPEYVPGGGWDDDHVFDPDRPGPIGIPRTGDGRQPVGVVLRFTADHPFTLYCG